MSIYTKKGDRGETGIYRKVEGKSVRLPKSAPLISAIGAVDELNSYLGIVSAFSEGLPLVKKEIERMQINLLNIGSILAGSDLKFSKSQTTHLENLIDLLDTEIPPLTNFILPGGSKTASLFQFARALSRRAEREVVAYSESGKVKPSILTYLNRLSDSLYTFARWANLQEGGKEIIWIVKKR